MSAAVPEGGTQQYTNGSLATVDALLHNRFSLCMWPNRRGEGKEGLSSRGKTTSKKKKRPLAIHYHSAIGNGRAAI